MKNSPAMISTEIIQRRIGGETMKRSSTRQDRFELGFITATDQGKGRWKFEYRDLNGNRHRPIVPAADLGQAYEIAKAYNVEIASQREIPGMRRLKSGYTMHEAIAVWLRSLAERANPPKDKTLSDYRVALNNFGCYMADNFPGISHWNQLRTEHAEGYKAKLSNMSYSTQRRRLVVLRMIASELHRKNKEQYQDFTLDADLSLEEPYTEDKEQPNERQIRHLFQWFRCNYPLLWAQLVLEVCAGVRGFEACYLRVSDVDLVSGVIAIKPKEEHKLKNPGSQRTIPLCVVAVDALKEYQRRQKIKSITPSGPFFPNSLGKSFTDNSICSARMEAFKAYKSYLKGKHLPSMPEGFLLRELRSVFTTTAIRADVSEIMLSRYIGHTVSTGAKVNRTMRKHYVKLTVDDLRRGVIDKIEGFMAVNGQLNQKAC